MLGRRRFIRNLISVFAKLGVFGSFIGLVSCENSPKNTGEVSRVPISVAKLDSLKPGFNEFKVYRAGIFLQQQEGRKSLTAVSMLCTHQTCAIAFEGSRFRCPCHGSVFSKKGKALAGPAKKPLRWLKLSVSKDQEVFLHPWENVGPEWNLEVVEG